MIGNRRDLSSQLCRFLSAAEGFSAAEAALLACLLGAACIVTGLKLAQGAATAADHVDGEIATGSPDRQGSARPPLAWNVPVGSIPRAAEIQRPPASQPPALRAIPKVGDVGKPDFTQARAPEFQPPPDADVYREGKIQVGRPVEFRRTLAEIQGPKGEIQKPKAGIQKVKGEIQKLRAENQRPKLRDIEPVPGKIDKPGTIQKSGTIEMRASADIGSTQRAGSFARAAYDVTGDEAVAKAADDKPAVPAATARFELHAEERRNLDEHKIVELHAPPPLKLRARTAIAHQRPRAGKTLTPKLASQEGRPALQGKAQDNSKGKLLTGKEVASQPAGEPEEVLYDKYGRRIDKNGHLTEGCDPDSDTDLLIAGAAAGVVRGLCGAIGQIAKVKLPPRGPVPTQAEPPLPRPATPEPPAPKPTPTQAEEKDVWQFNKTGKYITKDQSYYEHLRGKGDGAWKTLSEAEASGTKALKPGRRPAVRP